MEDYHLVFVSGTLKNGHSRHSILEEQRYIGIAKTIGQYFMFKTISYPCLVESKDEFAGKKIYGELYEVDTECLRVLDDIEGVEYNVFQRREIILDEITIVNLPLFNETLTKLYKKTAEAYFYQKDVSGCKEAGFFWPIR
jgi:hypothetical protein